ncbi:MAG: hypothetical protein IPK74_29960 [Deltaproteobacteria bacterium]|nr:hypothetical protein [Deltaproteobacteria bacterium]
MDLLSGGSAGSIDRLCRDFGVDPRRPGGIYRPPTNWKPRIVIAAIVLALVGAFILGIVIKP